MKPVLSSPKLTENESLWSDDWTDKDGSKWFCRTFLKNLFQIPKETKSIRVHAYSASPHKDAIEIEMEYDKEYEWWEWKCVDDPNLNGNLYIVTNETLDKSAGRNKLLTLFIEVELIN